MNHQITLSQAIEGFLLSCRSRRLSEHTVSSYRSALKHFSNFVSGNTDITEINHLHVVEFLSRQPVSNKTLYNYHISISAFYTWAVREELVDQHIMKRVPRANPEKPDIIPYTKKDVVAMLQASRSQRDPLRYRAIILLLLDTGIRADELCNLLIHQTDLKNQRINVWGKGAKQRVIPLSSNACQAIWKYLTQRPEANMGETTFVTYENKKMNRRRLLDAIQRIGNRAGVVDVTIHRFRHTFAITYLRNGGDVYTLQRILGHTTLNMVKRYLAIAEADVEKAHKKASPVANWGL